MRYRVISDSAGYSICDQEEINDLPLKNGWISLQTAVNRLNNFEGRKSSPKEEIAAFAALGKKLDRRNKTIKKLQAKNKKLGTALNIARNAMDKASTMSFRELKGIDKMLAEQEDLIRQAPK